MDQMLVNLFAFLRPLLFAEVGWSVGGLNILELAAILFVGLLAGALAFRAVTEKDIRISGIDVVIVMFVVWCTTATVVFYPLSDPRDLARLLLPFVTYTVVKNVYRDQERYPFAMWLMVLGFIVPMVASLLMVLAGKGVFKVNYWTGVPRYEGIYNGPHTLAHNMAFMVMLIAVYVAVCRSQGREIVRGKWVLFGILGLVSAYLLHKSAVRTAILGLIIFYGIYLFAYNRRRLVLVAVLSGPLLLLFSGAMQNLFFDFAKVAGGEWGTEALASSRPERWSKQWDNFTALSIEHQMAGVGIGNRSGTDQIDPRAAAPTAVDSHNDYLEVLVQTGAVGFLLYMLMQLLILKQILRMGGDERWAFLALFVAVSAMNFGSNSYVSRFGLGQMYLFMLSYIEAMRLGNERANRVAGARAEQSVAVAGSGG